MQRVKVPADYPGDRTGLILRVTINRGRVVKTLRFRHFREGSAKYAKLGEYGAGFTLADIHELHGQCEAADNRGEDPKAIVAAYWAARAPGPAAAGEGGPTVADVVKEFLLVASRTRKRPEQAAYLLEANVIPSLGHRPAASIRKRDLVECFDKIVNRGSRVLANRVRDVLKQAFSIAADRDLIESVPIFPKAKPGGRESKRTRVLTDAELKVLWHGLDEHSTGEDALLLRPLALALKLQLVTAQRRGEIAAARWDHVVANVWTIPPQAKRGQERAQISRRVALSPLAVTVLDELRALAPDSAYWLPSARTKKLSVDRARSITKAAREARKTLKMTNWRPHDLRRTARTNMAKLGVPEEIAERVLGHGHEDPMVETYNQHTYETEIRGALLKWATELERIVS